MKKIFKIVFIILAVFVIGGLGGLVIDYIIFTKLLTHPVWSQNKIIRAFDSRVDMIKTVEKVVVADNESIADIASRAAGTVVYIETTKTDGTIKGGNGVVVSSDGVIVTTNNIVNEDSKNISVKLSDGAIYDAYNVYFDTYTGLVFLRIDTHDLATIAFANSDDARSGKRLISIARTRSGNSARFALGGFFGHDYVLSTSSPVSDFLQGVLLVDFSDTIFRENIGAPVVDFHGDMLGLIALQNTQTSKQFYAIAANDIHNAFNDFLIKQDDKNEPNIMNNALLGIDYEMITALDVHADNMDITSGALISVPQTYFEQANFAKTLAARNGIKGGDIIITVNNDTVDTKNNLSRLMHKNKDSKKIIVKVLRNGELMTIEIDNSNSK